MMAELSESVLRAQFQRLFRIARGFGHPAAEAEDLAQDCLAALAAGGFEGRASLDTWLYRILWNKHVDRLRARPVRSAAADPVTPASNAAEAAERREIVSRALQRLPDLSRAILFLRYFENLSYSVIGEILDRPVGTLKSDCFRALERMHDLLERDFGVNAAKEWL
jgi:RNA polymerase sigma-70 factor (ECF subfamily)